MRSTWQCRCSDIRMRGPKRFAKANRRQHTFAAVQAPQRLTSSSLASCSSFVANYRFCQNQQFATHRPGWASGVELDAGTAEAWAHAIAAKETSRIVVKAARRISRIFNSLSVLSAPTPSSRPCSLRSGFSHVRILTNDRSFSYLGAATVAALAGCHVASGLYATISLAIWSVLGPRSF
jgi:hypothetical protein